jgi:high affinity sulfate transporter 1
VTDPHAGPRAPTTLERWFPAGDWAPKYAWAQSLRPDLLAAISVAALLIPESLGYSTVAGVPVQIGLYAAPLALIGYALFGGSRLLVFSAAGSVAAVSGSVISSMSPSSQGAAVTFTAGLALASGVVFLVAGLARLGWIANFMSKAVMAGFITGMAIQIIVGQLGHLVGLESGSGNTFQKLWSILSRIGEWSWVTLALGLGALALIFALQHFVPLLPAALTAVVVTSGIVAIFDPAVAVLARIPEGPPSLGLPTGISWSDWTTLALGAGIVSLVGFSEGWGAEAAVSRKTHDELDSNQEFRAYGVGNLGAGLLGGMAVTGSLSKSTLAVSAGARSQMANVFVAAIVLLTLLILAPAFQWLPEAVLAAVVINAMWEAAGPAKLEQLRRVDRFDFALGLITASMVLAFNLLPAMVTGIVLSIVLLVYRISFPGRAVLGRVEPTGDFEAIRWEAGERSGVGNPQATRVPGVLVYRLDAPLVYSNAEVFKKSGQQLLIDAAAGEGLPKAIVIDCEQIFFIDVTGAAALSGLLRYAQHYGVELVLARLHSAARQPLVLSGTMAELGEDHVYASVREAVAAAANLAPARPEPSSGHAVVALRSVARDRD